MKFKNLDDHTRKACFSIELRPLSLTLLIDLLKWHLRLSKTDLQFCFLQSMNLSRSSI